MFVSKAEYRVRAEFSDRNLENIKAFLPLVDQRLKPGSSYSVAVSEDGRSFLHLFVHQAAEDTQVLAEIPEFHHFIGEVMAGCEAPPDMTVFQQI